MKNKIDYFNHFCDSHEHAKFNALINVYGAAGYGSFWILNELIGKSEGCYLDLSKSYKKMDAAQKMQLSLEDFENFIEFLINDVELVIKKDDMITTKRVQEVFENVMKNREAGSKRQQKHRQNKKEESNKVTPKTSTVEPEVTNLSRVTNKNEGDLSRVTSEQSKVEENKEEEKEKESTKEKAQTKSSLTQGNSEFPKKEIEVERKSFRKDNLEARLQWFREEVIASNESRSEKGKQKLDKFEVEKFVNHFSATISVGSAKMMFEKLRYGKKTTFDVSRRLDTWSQNTQQRKAERAARPAFSETNKPTSKRLNDVNLSAADAEKYQKYLTWVQKKFPDLVRSDCAILSKSEYLDIQNCLTHKGSARLTATQKTNYISTAHKTLNEKGYQRKKYTCFTFVQAHFSNHFKALKDEPVMNLT